MTLGFPSILQVTIRHLTRQPVSNCTLNQTGIALQAIRGIVNFNSALAAYTQPNQ
jgi:hypothetical protein